KMTRSLAKNSASGFGWILFKDDGSKRGNRLDVHCSCAPRGDDVRYRLKAEAACDSGHKPGLFVTFLGATACLNRLSPDPMAAAFGAEKRTPSASANHDAIGTPSDCDRACSRDQQNAGLESDCAQESDKGIPFNEDFCSGQLRLDAFAIK